MRFIIGGVGISMAVFLLTSGLISDLTGLFLTAAPDVTEKVYVFILNATDNTGPPISGSDNRPGGVPDHLIPVSLSDLCGAVFCGETLQTCIDGTVVRCANTCDPATGLCSFCEPDCAGHDNICDIMTCLSTTTVCPDGAVVSCIPSCDPTTSLCGTCTPDCSGHGAAVNQTNQTHLACVSNACTVVDGAGTDECATEGSFCGNQTSQSTCGNAVCETDETVTCPADCGGNYTASCTDNDGGRIYDTAGTTSGYTTTGSFFNATDYCQDGSWLTEYYCATISALGGGSYSCLANGFAGCADGACVPFPDNRTNQTVCGDSRCDSGEATCPQDCGGNATVSCTDSDGGRNFHIQGTTFGYTDTGTYFSYTDTCSTTYPGWVSEWFCPEHGIVAEQSLICEYGCENGACLPPP